MESKKAHKHNPSKISFIPLPPIQDTQQLLLQLQQELIGAIQTADIQSLKKLIAVYNLPSAFLKLFLNEITIYKYIWQIRKQLGEDFENMIDFLTRCGLKNPELEALYPKLGTLFKIIKKNEMETLVCFIKKYEHDPKMLSKLLNMEAKNGDTASDIISSLEGRADWMIELLQKYGLYIRSIFSPLPEPTGQTESQLLTVIKTRDPNRLQSFLEKYLHLPPETLTADLDASSAMGNTALHLAVLCNQPKMVRLLMTHGANPNAQNRNEDTPLHLAFKNESLPCIKELIKTGIIDIYIRNHQDKTPPILLSEAKTISRKDKQSIIKTLLLLKEPMAETPEKKLGKVEFTTPPPSSNKSSCRPFRSSFFFHVKAAATASIELLPIHRQGHSIQASHQPSPLPQDKSEEKENTPPRSLTPA